MQASSADNPARWARGTRRCWPSFARSASSVYAVSDHNPIFATFED
jgi:hypothetical protein